mmetsp:Transcript_18965/g.33413  ORF Transcript_18965/g.33413 Transcript_18965/m.33413 type:complete len:202 (-) Transcript_18965:13-618(-)
MLRSSLHMYNTQSKMQSKERTAPISTGLALVSRKLLISSSSELCTLAWMRVLSPRHTRATKLTPSISMKFQSCPVFSRHARELAISVLNSLLGNDSKMTRTNNVCIKALSSSRRHAKHTSAQPAPVLPSTKIRLHVLSKKGTGSVVFFSEPVVFSGSCQASRLADNSEANLGDSSEARLSAVGTITRTTDSSLAPTMPGSA